MTLIAETYVSHPDLLLARTIRTVPDAAIRVDSSPTTDPERPLTFIYVEGNDFDAFEAALEEDPTVADWLFVTQMNDRHLYRIGISDETHLLSPVAAEGAGHVMEARSHDTGWLAQIELPDRKPLRELRNYCQKHGITFSVRRLFPVTDDEAGATTLTDEQRKTLLVAYDGGYFDVPRRMTQEDLAEQLDITDSAVSQRLRRATARLVENVFDRG